MLTADARIVKTIGDAVMVVTSERTTDCIGLGVLRAVEREPHFPGVRVGLHYGPIVERRRRLRSDRQRRGPVDRTRARRSAADHLAVATLLEPRA